MKGAYSTDFEGIVNNLERRFRETSSNWMREEIAGWMSSSANAPSATAPA